MHTWLPTARCTDCSPPLRESHRSRGVCARAACRAAEARRLAREVQTRQEEADLRLRLQMASRSGIRDPAGFPVRRLPMQRQSAARQTAERIEQLRRHLLAIVAEAFDVQNDLELSSPASSDAATSALLVSALDSACAAACSLCRGDCCLSGGEHLAYLTADTIRRRRKARPEATASAIVAEYLSFIPRKAVAGGCFYQADTGCMLPREMRSDVCNGYFCHELHRFRSESVAVQAQAVKSNPDAASIRAFFVVTLPSGRRQTRFHDSPIA